MSTKFWQVAALGLCWTFFLGGADISLGTAAPLGTASVLTCDKNDIITSSATREERACTGSPSSFCKAVVSPRHNSRSSSHLRRTCRPSVRRSLLVQPPIMLSTTEHSSSAARWMAGHHIDWYVGGQMSPSSCPGDPNYNAAAVCRWHTTDWLYTRRRLIGLTPLDKKVPPTERLWSSYGLASGESVHFLL